MINKPAQNKVLKNIFFFLFFFICGLILGKIITFYKIANLEKQQAEREKIQQDLLLEKYSKIDKIKN